ncbi:MAG TPA: hypothetical protein VER79_12325 [Candidatus Limnocylindrales bacterium]|nr:hypothetical protein [Candidatus Limnocylindrales bacterium]
MIESLLQLAAFILKQDGELSGDPQTSLQIVYRDDRIEMIGSLTPPEMQLTGLVVNLNLQGKDEARFRMVENSRPFSIPKTAPSYNTVVMQWDTGGGLFLRSGLWQTYLEHLAHKIQAEIEAFNLLNQVPVNDSDLFADIPLNVASVEQVSLTPGPVE